MPEAGFRHYEQSLRVVELLERGTSDEPGAERLSQPGLNLTWEVRDGIARHSKGRADLADDTAILSATFEGKTVRIADRVAYINHDIDDALRAGVITAADLPRAEMAELEQATPTGSPVW